MNPVLAVGTEYHDLPSVWQFRSEAHTLIVSQREVVDIQLRAPSGDILFLLDTRLETEYLVDHPRPYTCRSYKELTLEHKQCSVADGKQLSHAESMAIVTDFHLRQWVVHDVSILTRIMQISVELTDTDHLPRVTSERSLITSIETILCGVVSETFYYTVVHSQPLEIADYLPIKFTSIQSVKLLNGSRFLIADVYVVAVGIISYCLLVVVDITEFAESVIVYCRNLSGSVNVDTKIVITFRSTGIGDYSIMVAGKPDESAVVARRDIGGIELGTYPNIVGHVVGLQW